MIKGYYKLRTAIPCNKEDMHFFKRMMKNEPIDHINRVFVREVKIGDIFISTTFVKRWRIISEDGKLYLGFYESPSDEPKYAWLEQPHRYYVIEKDMRKNTSQKYMLLRIPRCEAMRYMKNM